MDRFKLFSIKILVSDFDFQSRLWQDVIGLYEVRDSLVHNNGLVSDFGKRESVESFVNRNQSFQLDDNDIIIISHQACLDAINMVETFFEQITEFAFRIFPDRYGRGSSDTIQ